MYYNKTYFYNEKLTPEILNGIQDDIINIIIPHLEEYGFTFTFTKYTYSTNEFPLISNISAIENIIDEMGQAINYTVNSDYEWIEKKNWTAGGKQLFGAEDLNRWCNNLMMLEAYSKEPVYNFVKIATPTKVDNIGLEKNYVILKSDNVIHSLFRGKPTFGGLQAIFPTKYDINTNQITKLNDEKLYKLNCLCVYYGSYIYVFSGIKYSYKAEVHGSVQEVNAHEYYKFNIETNKWVMENGYIKAYSCPYTFNFLCCDVIFYNNKFIFSYTQIDENNIPIYDDHENISYVYSETDTGTLKFIEFDPSNETWAEKNWGNWNIFRSYDNDTSYNRMVKAPNNVIYFSLTRTVNGEKTYWLYKIENNNVDVVNNNLPGGVSKMFYNNNALYMVCNKRDEFHDAIYKYDLITNEITLLNSGYDVFEYGTQFYTTYYFEDGKLYYISGSELYELQKSYE